MTEKNIDIYIELPERRYLEAWRMFKGNKAAVLGLCMWGMIVFMALFGSLIYQVDPFELVGEPMTAPDSEYMFGTDYLGRDVLAGIIHGARVTLIIGFSATLCTVIIGVIVGVLAGYYGKWVDNLLMRVTEFFQVLPALLLAMVLVTLFSPSMTFVA